jgi:hypothetical protein
LHLKYAIAMTRELKATKTRATRSMRGFRFFIEHCRARQKATGEIVIGMAERAITAAMTSDIHMRLNAGPIR